MSASRYRQHDEVPGPQSSSLQYQVGQEWVRLNQDSSAAVLLRRWAVRYPLLSEMSRPADVVDAIDGAGPAGKDALLRSLVELFQSGEQLAGRIALQAMLPKLSHFAFRTNLVGQVEPRPDDRFQMVLCEFWEVLGRLPIHRRQTRVAANLAMETWHRLTRMRRSPDLPVDPATISALAERSGDTSVRPEPLSTEPSAEPDPDGDLEALLTWAVARGTISREDALLMRRVYLGSEPGGRLRDVSRGYREHAASTGTSPSALRQRARRARQRLTAAVADALSLADGGERAAGRGAGSA